MHTNFGQHVCTLCKNKFNSKTSLLKHKNRKNCTSSQNGKSKTKKRIKCGYCAQYFETQNALSLHIKNEHYEAAYIYKCPKCDKKFKNQTGRSVHQSRIHNSKKKICMSIMPIYLQSIL